MEETTQTQTWLDEARTGDLLALSKLLTIHHPVLRASVVERMDKQLKLNKDAYINYRAQTWTWTRDRFKATYEAIQRVAQGLLVNVDPENLISIDSGCECLHELKAELSRPRRIFTNNGKIKVEAKKDMKARGVDSPNLADDVIMALSVKKAKKRTQINTRPRRMKDRAVGY